MAVVIGAFALDSTVENPPPLNLLTFGAGGSGLRAMDIIALTELLASVTVVSP